MKRHPHLTQLSGDHHAAMTVAERILKGLERGADPTVIAAYAHHAWERWLAGHNRLEEKLVVDGLADTPIDPRMTRRLIQEHQEMTLLGAKLADRSSRLPAILSEFAGTLRNHVRFEEQELIPALARHLPVDETAEPVECDIPETGWSVVFWE